MTMAWEHNVVHMRPKGRFRERNPLLPPFVISVMSRFLAIVDKIDLLRSIFALINRYNSM